MPLGRPGRRWKNNIKTDLKIGCDCMHCIQLVWVIVIYWAGKIAVRCLCGPCNCTVPLPIEQQMYLNKTG